MPTYTYKCLGCEKVIDVVQRMSDDRLTECKECSGELKKIITATGGFQLKGKGWFNKGGY